MCATTEGYTEPFDLFWLEDEEVYVQRYEFFLEAHDIVDTNKQRDTFLS